MNRKSKTYMLLPFVTFVTCLGCALSNPSPHTLSRDYNLEQLPVDRPNNAPKSFENDVSGGRLFQLYCASCHEGRPLGERPFRETAVTFSHMRTQAYLTGTEYRKLVHYLRRWHDLGPTFEEVEASPKRFFYSQPITELKPEDQRSLDESSS